MRLWLSKESKWTCCICKTRIMLSIIRSIQRSTVLSLNVFFRNWIEKNHTSRQLDIVMLLENFCWMQICLTLGYTSNNRQNK
ncbi:unnamed protein product [Strongylus vulgaris]|uniref:Uncharacterized protein n=1 Tax=Strongylus vulgaris TaxID=40348 RepID=A0A3P7JE50_STRVU|nr:unnamed protein product [Strongylus vulgaris]